MDLSKLIETSKDALHRQLEGFPDVSALLRHLQGLLADTQPEPWFPSVPFEQLIHARMSIEEVMDQAITRAAAQDPMVQAEARARLRRVLGKLVSQYAANLDRDLAQLKARNQALKDQVDRQQALSDGLLKTRHAGVAVLDASGRVLAWSAGAALVTHRSAMSMMGRSIGTLLPEVAELLQEHLGDPRSALAGSETPLEGTCPLEREPGVPAATLSFRLGVLRGFPGPQNEAAVLSLWDVTELQNLRARVVESDRLQAMARIAGAVAHEIRNPLNSLFLNTDLLEMELVRAGTPAPRVDHLLGIVRQEVERLNDIVTDYLSLARLADRQRETLDLSILLSRLFEELEPWREEQKIALSLEIAPGPHLVAVDAKQLRRALLNLLTNAREAMPQGGALYIGLTLEADEAVLTIRDSGTGMTPEELDRVSTPFFTRKEGGTGLGLYLTREILLAHHGRLELDSAPGQGTTARVILPTLRTA